MLRSVGDRQRRTTAGQNPERFLDRFFRLGVDAARRFVEDQDLGIIEQSTRDRDPLLLAPGKAGASFAQPGVVAERRADDKVVCLRGAGGRDRVQAVGIRPTVDQVVADRAAEQKRLLKHDADVLPQIGRRQVADIHAVEQHAAGVDVIKSADQIDERRLAAAAVTDDADFFAGPDR